jgi:hypothetical protein
MPKKFKQFYTNQLGGGINTMSAPDAIPFFSGREPVQAQWAELENWVPNSYGSLTKATGFTLDHTSGTASPISGMCRYTKNNGNTFFVYTQGANLWQRTGAATRTNISSSLAVTTTPCLTVAQDLLIVCDGTNAPLTWNGTVTGVLDDRLPAVGSPNVCVGATGFVYSQRRGWLFGMPADPSFLLYSTENDITDGYATQIVACNVGDGGKITCVQELFRPDSFETALVVFKSNGTVGLVTGDGSPSNPFTYSVISRDGACLGLNGAVQMGQNMAYLTTNGVSTLETDLQNVNLNRGELSALVKNRFSELDKVNLKNAIVQQDPAKNRICFLVPENGQTYPTVIWHYHTGLKAWYKERWPDGYRATSSFIDADDMWYHADESGKIYRHDTVFSFDGKSINAVARTPYINFGKPVDYKLFNQCSLMVAGFGESQISASFRYDNGARSSQSLDVAITQSRYLWGAGQWKSDGSYMWQATQQQRPRFYPPGHFRNCQITCTHNSTAGPIQLFELVLGVEFTGGY